MCGTKTRYPFYALEYQQRYLKTICSWLHMFNIFVPTCAVAFCTMNEQNKTYKYYIEGFVPGAIL